MLLHHRRLKSEYRKAVQTPYQPDSLGAIPGEASVNCAGEGEQNQRAELLKLLVCEALDGVKQLEGKLQTTAASEEGDHIRVSSQLRACTLVGGEEVAFDEVQSSVEILRVALASLLEEL